MSYTLRSQIPENTHTMLRLHQEVKFSHNESAPGRKDRDNNDECLVPTILKRFKVFSPTEHPACLYKIVITDLVTDESRLALKCQRAWLATNQRIREAKVFSSEIDHQK